MRTPVENWREGTRAGHTHEPNDVTVQLDGLGRQLSELPVEPGTPENSDGPVFVDESGRRSKTYRRLGWVLATICAIYAVTLVVAVLGGNSTAPWLPISGQEDKQPAGVEVQPAPTDDQGTKTESPGPLPSSSVSTDPSATSSLPPAGSATGTVPARTGTDASATRSVPPKGNGSATNTKPPVTTGPESPAASTPAVEDTPPSADPTTTPPTDPVDPPVQGQEGAL